MKARERRRGNDPTSGVGTTEHLCGRQPRSGCLPMLGVWLAMLPTVAGVAAAAEQPTLTLESIIGDTRGVCMENQSVTTTADGTICLLMRNNRITMFDSAGKYVRSETSPRPLRWPRYDTYVTGIGSRVFVGELHLDYPWVFDGKKGAGPGQFNQPADVATDDGGRTYVADQGNRRIQVFNKTDREKPVYVLLVEGSPVSVAVAAGRIATVTAEGHLFLFAVDADGTNPIASLKVGSHPKDLCFTPSGDILCCFSGGRAGHELKRYRCSDGKLSIAAVLARSWRAQWPNLFPSSVVISPGRDGRTILFTAREDRRVLELDVTTNKITELVRGGPQPLAACHDPAGSLLVGCAMSKRDGPGQVVYTYEPEAKGFKQSRKIPREGHFSTHVDSNLLYGLLPTADGGVYVRVVGEDGWTGFRIKKVYPDGRLEDWLDLGKRLFAKVKRLGPPSWSYALQHDGRGHIIAALRIIGSVAKVTPAGEVIWQSGCLPNDGGERIDFGWPSDVAIDSRGNVWVADAEHHRLYCLDGVTGHQIWEYGTHGGVDKRNGHHFSRPTGVEVAQHAGVEYLIVGDAGNQRLLKFRLQYGRKP